MMGAMIAQATASRMTGSVLQTRVKYAMLVATITPWSFKWRMKQSVAKKPDTKMNDSQASVLLKQSWNAPITNDGLAIGRVACQTMIN